MLGFHRSVAVLPFRIATVAVAGENGNAGNASTLRSSRLFTGRCLGTSRVTRMADDCRLVTDARARRLRSADTRTLAVGRTQSTFGDRTFAAAAPRLWNSLPPDLRQPGLPYGQFRHSLKTFLFGQ